MASETLDVIVNAIVEVSGIDRGELGLEVNVIDDLGIDSVDMLDIVYELNRHFAIDIPIETWAESITSGSANTSEYFVLERFAAHVERLVKEASSGRSVAL